MSERQPTSRRDEWLEFWERREVPVLKAMPYALLLLCVGFDIATRHGVDGAMLVDLGLALTAAVLMAAMDRVDRRGSWTDAQTAVGTGVAVVFFAVLVAISAALVISEPVYGFYSWTGYLWAWRLLEGRARLAGVAVVAAITAVSQTGSGPTTAPPRLSLWSSCS